MPAPAPYPQRSWRRIILTSLLCGIIATPLTALLAFAVSPKHGWLNKTGIDRTADSIFYVEWGFGVDCLTDSRNCYQTPPDLPSTDSPGWAEIRYWRNRVGHPDIASHDHIYAYGWPIRWMTRITAYATGTGIEYPLYTWPGKSRREAEPSYEIPTHILPLRFIACTAVWTAVSFPVLIGPGIIRRASRKRKIQCPTCGYSLKDLPTPTCPECGTTTLPPRP